MNIIYFLIPIALILGIVFLIFYIWAVRSGQFDDLLTPSLRMLLDENEITLKPKKEKD